MSETMKINKWITVSLGLLQMFVSILAIPAAILLITDPSGGSMSWTLENLEGSPFSNYLIPGIVLLIINGFGSLIGGVLSFKHHRYSGIIAVCLGIFLVLWILSQLWWMGYGAWLQPFILILGVIEVILGTLLLKSQKKN